jgi:hypothetical protein
MLDAAGATATTAALLSQPELAAFAATAIAQAATISASAESGGVALLPGEVITVTATFTPEPAALAQRPVEPPPLPPPLDTRSFFVRVLDSAGSTVALLWFLGGSVLFFVTAGVLAGLSFRTKERARFALEPDAGDADFIAQPLAGPPPTGEQSAGSNKTGDTQADDTQADDNWPASLP